MSRRFDIVTFDCYGTLVDWETGISSSFGTEARKHGLNLERAFPNTSPSPSAARPSDPVSPQRILTAAEIRTLERDNIMLALELAEGKISGTGGAAERLGVHANTLSSRIKALKLQ